MQRASSGWTAVASFAVGEEGVPRVEEDGLERTVGEEVGEDNYQKNKNCSGGPLVQLKLSAGRGFVRQTLKWGRSPLELTFQEGSVGGQMFNQG